MTAGVSPSVTPIFIELATHDIPRVGKEPGDNTRILSIDAFCPTRTLSQRFTSIVNPEAEVSAVATERYGITEADAKKARKFEIVWTEFQKWAQPEGSTSTVVLIAHRIYSCFGSLLRQECRRCEKQFPADWKAFDTAYLVNCLPDFRQWDEMSLGEIANVPKPCSVHVYEILRQMADGVPLEQLYPSMLSKHPIREVADRILDGVPAVATTSTAPVNTAKVTAAKTNTAGLRVLVFDTETTGLLKKSKFLPGPDPRVIELAAYDPDRNEYFTRLINPDMPIPAIASSINKITDPMVKKAPRFKAVWQEFWNWAHAPINGVVPKIIAMGHNIFGFDNEVLRLETARTGESFPDNWAFTDTLYLARTLKLPPKHKLTILAAKFGIAIGTAHRAQEDVRLTWELFKKLIGNTPIQRVYQEILTPGVEPIIRLGKLIQASGGPTPFGAVASTSTSVPAIVAQALVAVPEVEEPKPTSAVPGLVEPKPAPKSNDDDDDNVTFAPPERLQVPPQLVTTLGTRKVEAPTDQVDLLSKITAGVILELYTRMSGTTFASTSVTATVPMALPEATSTTAGTTKRKRLSPEEAERERTRLFFQRHYNGDINQVPANARFQFREFIDNAPVIPDNGGVDLDACAEDDARDLRDGKDDDAGSLKEFVATDHESASRSAPSSEGTVSDDDSSSSFEPVAKKKKKQTKAEDSSSTTIPMSAPASPKR